MRTTRQLIVSILILAIAAPAAAQSQQEPPRKGALIGALVGRR